MGNRTIIDAKLFGCVKVMLKGGAKYSEIEEYLGVSKATIGRIVGAENYEQYKLMLAAKFGYKKKEPEQESTQQVVEHRQTVTIQATHYMMEEMKKTNELLTLISNKLAFIVEELTGKECKE